MRFILIGPVWPYRGGISHNTAIVSKAVTNAGHDIRLISFRRQYPQWLYPGQTDQDNSRNPIKANAEYILDPFSPKSWKKAADVALSFKPNLVMIQWWTFFWSIPFAWISRYLLRRGTKVVYLIHNVTPHESHPFDRLLTHLALSPAQGYLVFSDFEKQKLHTLLPGKRIVLSHLPVYSFNQGGHRSKAEARSELNLPKDGPILLFFGFVRPYKGLDILIKALAKLKQEAITPYLSIVGEFWKDKQKYLEQIAMAGIQDQIRIEDRYVPNEEADLWFTAADVLVAPYTHGVTQSAVASIAVGYGTPMIVTTHVAEGLEQVGYPWIQVVPSDDIGALARELTNFLSSYSAEKNPIQDSQGNDSDLVQAILELAQ
ncbi:MAG TPA: glycosyltransferase [Anaerolineales bacterium]|nr:glycosyltransferase [Anaerolineales bacterium]